MSYNFSKSELAQHLQNQGSTLLFKEISTDVITPVAAFLKIESEFPKDIFLFESAEKGNHKGRFSVIGFMPDQAFKIKDQQTYINKEFQQNPQNFIKQNGNAFDNFRQFTNAAKINWDKLNYRSNRLPSICCGTFGYMSYDMVRLMEDLPNNNLPDEIQIPDCYFIRPQIIIIFDNLFDCALICAPIFNDAKKDNDFAYNQAVSNISLAEKILQKPLPNHTSNQTVAPFNFTSNYSEEDYCQAVLQVKKYITDGDIFQALPSQRFSANFPNNISPFNFYRSLRSINPSPFLFFLKLEDFVLTGSSPEIMVSLKDKKVTVRPLAGTRKRGKNSDEDAKIAAELLQDEKEIAEHLMLIDLGRHDVGRVAKAGTVEVSEKMIIENYSHVMHISSNVVGILDEQYDALDALISAFPAGTVSGAPKIRAMEILEEIEKVKRSFYAGCVGYFAGNGDMETCITLRSALIKNNKIYLQSGAGVVFDSDPKSEYQECLNKAQALMKAANSVKD